MQNLYKKKYISIQIMLMLALHSSFTDQLDEISTKAFNFATSKLKQCYLPLLQISKTNNILPNKIPLCPKQTQ